MEEFGAPEAIWEFEVAGFPAVVTMDAAAATRCTKKCLPPATRELAKLL